MIHQIIATTSVNAVEQINRLRLSNKNNWVYAEVNLNGLDFQFKFYNNWVQIAKGPSGRDSGLMDQNVGYFKKFLTDFFQK
jgi:hypothetical protein